MNALFTNITTDFGEDSFDALAIPTNNFGLQEPGANSEIMNGLRYVRPGNDFVPLYKVAMKNEANGLNEDPLFTFLKAACLGTVELIGEPSGMYWSPVRMHDLTWNFEKFLIDQNGKPIKRYSPSESVDNLYPDVVALLNNAKKIKVEEEKPVPELIAEKPKVADKPKHTENHIKKPRIPIHLNMKKMLYSRLHHP